MVAWIRFRILFYIKWTYLSGKFFITRFPSTWKGSNQFKEYWRIQPSAKVHQHSFVLDLQAKMLAQQPVSVSLSQDYISRKRDQSWKDVYLSYLKTKMVLSSCEQSLWNETPAVCQAKYQLHHWYLIVQSYARNIVKCPRTPRPSLHSSGQMYVCWICHDIELSPGLVVPWLYTYNSLFTSNHRVTSSGTYMSYCNSGIGKIRVQ